MNTSTFLLCALWAQSVESFCILIARPIELAPKRRRRNLCRSSATYNLESIIFNYLRFLNWLRRGKNASLVTFHCPAHARVLIFIRPEKEPWSAPIFSDRLMAHHQTPMCQFRSSQRFYSSQTSYYRLCTLQLNEKFSDGSYWRSWQCVYGMSFNWTQQCPQRSKAQGGEII